MPRITITPEQANSIMARLIHQYSYKPAPVISYREYESHDEMTFGLELEVAMRPSRYQPTVVASLAQAIRDVADGRVYLKRDGSVSTGFEIVSHPASLASHMYDAHWSGILNKCKKHDFVSHDAKRWGGSCGLHIHVGRAQLGRNDAERENTIRKVKVLVYRHWDEMVRFSRRDPDQLSNWASRELRANFLRELAAGNASADDIRTSNTHNGRYIAVNCENSATIEFRLFNGTLQRDTLMAALQLVNSICLYAMRHTWSDVLNCTFLDMATYRRFNELDTYLVARGLASEGYFTERAQNTQRNPRHVGYDGLEA